MKSKILNALCVMGSTGPTGSTGQMKNISYKEEVIRPHRGRITSNGVKKAKDYSFKLLSYRPRSIKEIEGRLKKKDYSSRIISEVIKDLKRLKFLNDKEFARMWVESRIKTRPMGRYRLEQELIQKGIDRELIEKVLSNYREEEEIKLARELAQRKLKRSYRNLDEVTTKRRLYSFLQRRGFSYDTIQEAMKEIRRTENEGE